MSALVYKVNFKVVLMLNVILSMHIMCLFLGTLVAAKCQGAITDRLHDQSLATSSSIGGIGCVLISVFEKKKLLRVRGQIKLYDALNDDADETN
jgi:hypothetical protein